MEFTPNPKSTTVAWRTVDDDPVLRRLQPPGIPILFEDEGTEMGESMLHTLTCGILLYGLKLHFIPQADITLFANLNLYYSDDDPTAYVSPDLMAVQTPRRFPEEVASYRIGEDDPAPRLTVEVLSYRTYQEGDLSNKPLVYADIGVEEYILVDVRGTMLAQKLLLLHRQPAGTWLDEQDADGGVTSRLGFRLVVEEDGHLRVISAATGARYPRPDEAGLRLRDLELAYQQLQAELAQLRSEQQKPKKPRPGNKRRRKP